jgi:hypothetical protein
MAAACIRQRMRDAYVQSCVQHTSAYVLIIRQHTSAYVSIRQQEVVKRVAWRPPALFYAFPPKLNP